MQTYHKLSVVIPVFNEEKTIERVIQAVENSPINIVKELVIVNDGSTDGTADILKKYHSSYKVISSDKNFGKGAALCRGFAESTGDIVLIQDADLEYNPQDYPALIRPIISGDADIVYGSRFLGSGRALQRSEIVYKHGYLFSRVLNWLSNVLSANHLSDMYTCYKVFSKDSIDRIYPHLVSKRFGIDPELTAWAAKLNFRIKEVPISYKGRSYAEGKKITWKDGLAAILHIVRFNIFK